MIRPSIFFSFSSFHESVFPLLSLHRKKRKGRAEREDVARELEKGRLMKVECKQQGRRGAKNQGVFVNCWRKAENTCRATSQMMLHWDGRREATHSLDLSLITAYLVVNNSNSAETQGEDEDGVTPDGCLFHFVPPCGSKAAQHGFAARGH